MEKFITHAVWEILNRNSVLMSIVFYQKAKFEGWLKFELASYLKSNGMQNVGVESGEDHSNCRCDISFDINNIRYRLELKTSNANWKIPGIRSGGKPITKNIKSIITDARKLNSENGLVVFVLFPLPIENERWRDHLTTITNETKIELNDQNLKLLNFESEDFSCRALICCFRSRRFIEV